MRKDADAHAEEDKHKRELAELRNKADTMCWQLEKLMKEHEAKLSAGDKDAMTSAIAKTREAAKADNVEAIKSAIGRVGAASHAFSKSLYERAAAAGDSPAPPPAATAPAPAGPGQSPPAATTTRSTRSSR